jgi:hypothetical protein
VGGGDKKKSGEKMERRKLFLKLERNKESLKNASHGKIEHIAGSAVHGRYWKVQITFGKVLCTMFLAKYLTSSLCYFKKI